MNNLFNNAVSVRSWLIGRRLVLAAALALALAVPVPKIEPSSSAFRLSIHKIAKRMRIEGVVKLSVTVDAEGKVTDVKTVAGNHMLSIAAEDAVRKWKFESGTGSATVDVSMSFALQ